MMWGYRYRLYPAGDQKVSVARHPGCCRSVYNRALDRKNQAYRADWVGLSGMRYKERVAAAREYGL